MWIILIVIVVIIGWIIAIYNTLVKLKNNRENAFADIDVQLKQRHDYTTAHRSRKRLHGA